MEDKNDKIFTPEEALKIRQQIEDRKERVQNASRPRFTQPFEDASEGNVRRDTNPPILTGTDMENRNALKGGLSTTRVTPLPKSRFGH